MKSKLMSTIKVLFLPLVAMFFFHSASNTAIVFAQAKQLVKIKIATATSGLDFAPIWIAKRKGYFKDEGIQFEHVLTRGGSPAMAALASGDVQFASTSASDVLLVRARGDLVVALGAFPVSLDWNIAAGNKWLESKGLTISKVKKMTIKEKILAMKGTTLGAATVGGAPAQVARYMFRLYGVKPDVDVQFVAVGFGPARVGALRKGQVNMIVGGIPDTEQPELEGWGVIYIRIGGEVEVFKDYPHESIHAMESYVKKNPNMVRAVLRALARGNNLILDNPAESDKLLSEHYRKLDPTVLKAVMKHARPKFRHNMKMTKSGWDNIQKVFVSTGKMKSKLNTAEGGFWTNKYLP
jgi:NitT/TauT family transport system substrate-binding protein